MVARAPGRGPARPRPALRDGRREARGARLASRGRTFEDGLARTVDWFVANEAWWRAARSGDWDAYYERQYGAPTGGLRAAATPRDRLTMRVAVTGASGRLGRRAGRGARGRAVHRSARARSPGRRADLDLDAPDGRRPSLWTATARRSSSTPRPGPTSTAAPAIPELAMRRNGDATGVLAAACADARHRPRSSSRPTRSSTAPRTDGRPYAPTTSRLAGEPVRRLASWPASAAADRRLRRDRGGGVARASPGRPGCSGPPGRDFPRKIARRGDPGRGRPASRCASSPTSGARPTYAADVADAIVELLAEDARRAASTTWSTAGVATRADWARDVARPGSASTSRSRTSRARPGQRASDAAALGRPRADAAAVRRADAAVAAGDGRLRAGPACGRWRAGE